MKLVQSKTLRDHLLQKCYLPARISSPPALNLGNLYNFFHQTLFSFVLGAKDSGRGFIPLFSHGPKDFFGRRSFTSVSLILRQFCPFWCGKSFFWTAGTSGTPQTRPYQIILCVYDAFVAKMVNTRLTKVCMTIFAPDERLPTSATLALLHLFNLFLGAIPRFHRTYFERSLNHMRQKAK